MRQKEAKIFEVIFRIKNQLKLLQDLLVEDEHEKQVALLEAQPRVEVKRKPSNLNYEPKKRGRPFGTKKK